MNYLIINAGSTTKKFKLYNDSVEILSGIIYKIDSKFLFKLRKSGEENEYEISDKDFENAHKLIMESIGTTPDYVGFRVVHGGEEFKSITKLDNEKIGLIQKVSSLAPLHNPPTVELIKKFYNYNDNFELFAHFDTAFHQSMPPKAFLYALPYEFYENYKIRKYGFHGISCEYIVEKLKILETEATKTIICHLGGGASVTAVKDYNSVDTSMGFTPLEGVMMATRSGDVDDGVIHYMIEDLKLSVESIKEIENKKSGLLGVSGITDDMRELLKLESEGNLRAKLAIEMYVYKIQKEISSLVASMGSIDSLVFTAGIGAGSDVIRERICKNLEYLHIKIDKEVNDGKINVETDMKISGKGSIPIWIIPTNEEYQIYRMIKEYDSL